LIYDAIVPRCDPTEEEVRFWEHATGLVPSSNTIGKHNARRSTSEENPCFLAPDRGAPHLSRGGSAHLSTPGQSYEVGKTLATAIPRRYRRPPPPPQQPSPRRDPNCQKRTHRSCGKESASAHGWHPSSTTGSLRLPEKGPFPSHSPRQRAPGKAERRASTSPATQKTPAPSSQNHHRRYDH
jgi:hypothetical protein